MYVHIAKSQQTSMDTLLTRHAEIRDPENGLLLQYFYKNCTFTLLMLRHGAYLQKIVPLEHMNELKIHSQGKDLVKIFTIKNGERIISRHI